MSKKTSKKKPDAGGGAPFSFREKYWFVFPSQMLQFFAREREEARLYRASLSPLEKQEIRSARRRMLLSFCASLALHAAFFLAVFSDFMEPVLLGEAEVSAESEADFKIMEGMVSEDLEPVYDEFSEFVIKPSELIKKKSSRLLSLDNLLEQLRAGKAAALSDRMAGGNLEAKKPSRLGGAEGSLRARLRGRKIKKSLSLSRIQLWDHVKTLKMKGGRGKANYSEIMKVIDKHNFQFQECYELGLLKDEKLSGKIIFLLKLDRSLVKKASLKLEGQGSPASRRALLRCLYRESKKLVFLKNKKKISIKFNLIFGI